MPLSFQIGTAIGLLGCLSVFAMVNASNRLARRYRLRKHSPSQHQSCVHPAGGPHIPFLLVLAGLIVALASGCELNDPQFNPAINVNSDHNTTITIMTNQLATNVTSEASAQ